MTTPYSVNWYAGQNGNGLIRGSTLNLKVEKAQHISGGVYRDNLPVLIFFEMGENVSLKLVKGRYPWGQAKPLPRGTYVLKTRAYVSGNGKGWDDEFEIY